MGLEAATYINDFTTTNPVTSDNVSQGDDHLRLIKAALKTTFPNADKAFYFPDFASKSADFTIVAADMNKTFTIDTTAGAVTGTLPTLTSADDGWTCSFLKTSTGTTPYFVAPPSGTIRSGEIEGLAKTRRAIPGHRSTAIWTGGVWYVTRVPSVPVGTILDFSGVTLPTGYEWPSGQTLASASTNYPDFYSVNGSSGVTLDARGRIFAARDDLGGSAASRLTTQITGGGTSVGQVGGAQTVAISVTELPVHSLTGVTGNNNDNHTHTSPRYSSFESAAAGSSGNIWKGEIQVAGGAPSVQHQHQFTTDSIGGGAAHNNVQPTMIMNKILVVE
jgi:microcystin-dependent protein